MKLITKQVARSLPPIGSTEDSRTKTFLVKFFHPMSNWTWFAIEANAVVNGREIPLRQVDDLATVEDVLFFGRVDGDESEWGYFSLRELESVKVYGLGIERDLYFTPTVVA